VEAFSSGGILAGLKAIGATILDAVLMPLQQLFELLAHIPGLGDIANLHIQGIQSLREGLGVNTTTDENGEPLKPAVSTKVAESDTRREEIENIKASRLTIEDKTGRGKLDNTNPMINMMPSLTSTSGGGDW
jgi:hypothetical protein